MPDFKGCSMCGHRWPSRVDFLDDPQVTLVGYQLVSDDPVDGLLLFNHTCGTTLALELSHFADLYRGLTYSRRLANTDSCQRHCTSESDLQRCTNECACAWTREVLQIVRDWPTPPG